MNARQTKKYLKKRINRLESDNDLMRSIIANSPKMQELYDLYNKPLNITHTTMPFQQFKIQRMIPDYMMVDDRIIMEHLKHEIAIGLVEAIKDIITYEVDSKYGRQTITGSIFVGNEVG